jgi:hypothetical protein
LPWPLFLNLIKKEEEYFRKISNEILNEIPKKNEKFIKTTHYKKDFKTEESEKNIEVFLWLKNKNYACRYDSFLLIYELTDKILYMSKDELEDEIWTLIDNINKNKYSFISKGYKVIKILIPLVN